jgi:polar amino acid transport system substrate-binding protein
VKRGFNYGDQWRAATDIKKHDVGTILVGFEMLDQDRLDGFLGYEYNWDYVLKLKKWESKYRKLPVSDSSAEHLIALKSNPEGIKALRAFDAGKKRLAKSGRLEAIEKKWFPND